MYRPILCRKRTGYAVSVMGNFAGLGLATLKITAVKLEFTGFYPGFTGINLA
jgi:hypothetical protein